MVEVGFLRMWRDCFTRALIEILDEARGIVQSGVGADVRFMLGEGHSFKTFVSWS